MFFPSGFRLLVACIVSIHVVAAFAAESITLRLDPGYGVGQRYDFKFNYQRETDTQTLLGDKEAKRELTVESMELTAVLVIKEVTAVGQLKQFDLLINTCSKTVEGKMIALLPERAVLNVRIEKQGDATMSANGVSLADSPVKKELQDFLDASHLLNAPLDSTIGRARPVKEGDSWDPGTARMEPFLGEDVNFLTINPATVKREVALKGVGENLGAISSIVQVTVMADLTGATMFGPKVSKGAAKMQYEFLQPVTGSVGVRSENSLSQAKIQMVMPGSAQQPATTTINLKMKMSAETRMAMRADGAPAVAPGSRPKPAGPRSKPAAEKEDKGGGGDDEVPDGWK